MDRAEKSAAVADLGGIFKATKVVVVAHYSGLTVAQMQHLRRQMRQAGASVKVAKNRLAKIALEGSDVASIAPLLKGPAVIAYSGDPIAAPKVAVDFAKTNEKFVILGGAMGKTSLDPNGVKALAALPSLDELRAIKEFCAANRLRVFLDGARLANAAAYLSCTLADLSGNADVLSFGGTKNGAMGVEAVIVMHAADTPNARYLRKQHGQLSSKMRFLGAQFDALLTDDLWLANAAHANAMAARLATGLAEIPGVEVVYPVQSDVVFARLDPNHIAELQRDWIFHVWDEGASVVRWMTAFDTHESDVDAFLSDIAAAAGVVRV